MLRPVIVDGFCTGHVLPTAKGFVAYDRDDVAIGIFDTAAAAIEAL